MKTCFFFFPCVSPTAPRQSLTRWTNTLSPAGATHFQISYHRVSTVRETCRYRAHGYHLRNRWIMATVRCTRVLFYPVQIAGLNFLPTKKFCVYGRFSFARNVLRSVKTEQNDDVQGPRNGHETVERWTAAATPTTVVNFVKRFCRKPPFLVHRLYRTVWRGSIRIII